MFSILNHFNYHILKENILEAFLLADRFLLLLLVILSLLLGLLAYGKKDTAQIYLVLALGITTFWVIKTSEKFYSNFAKETFLVTLIIFMGYLWFLVMGYKDKSIGFEVSRVFGILLLLENSESLIIFLGLYFGWFISGISILLDAVFRNLKYWVPYLNYVSELFNMPCLC